MNRISQRDYIHYLHGIYSPYKKPSWLRRWWIRFTLYIKGLFR